MAENQASHLAMCFYVPVLFVGHLDVTHTTFPASFAHLSSWKNVPKMDFFLFLAILLQQRTPLPKKGGILCRFPSDSQCTIFFSYLYAKDQFMSCHPFELCMGISGMVYSTQMPVDAAFCRGEGIWGVGGKFLPCNSLWVMIKVVGTCFLS